MLPRRRRRKNGRILPAVTSIVIGLSVAVGIYWYQNPDIELSVPPSLIDQNTDQSSQAPESFAVITATNTPDGVARSAETPATETNQLGQLRRLIPQMSSESVEEREARARMEAAERVSDLELKVHAGINAERAKQGRSPLEWDAGLASVARAHSDDMTGRDYFSHDTPEGLDPTDRLHRAGLNCRKGYRYGIAENIDIETTLGNLDRTAEEAVRGWINSPGHRTNLLNRGYNRTGVGASFGTWRGYKAVYLTQVFC